MPQLAKNQSGSRRTQAFMARTGHSRATTLGSHDETSFPKLEPKEARKSNFYDLGCGRIT